MSDPLRETTQESAPSSLWLGADAPRRSVLADEVYEILKSKLMDNIVEPGSRLSIDGLARDLGCSPTPIREALARLESDGLVAKRAHYGYTAALLIDAQSFAELFRMRLLLEPACASWAAQAASAPPRPPDHRPGNAHRRHAPTAGGRWLRELQDVRGPGRRLPRRCCHGHRRRADGRDSRASPPSRAVVPLALRGRHD